jgi:hypothetical protein
MLLFHKGSCAVKMPSDKVIHAMFSACHQNMSQISAQWLKKNHKKDSPDYPLNINCLNSSTLLISQHSNHVSPFKLDFMQNDLSATGEPVGFRWNLGNAWYCSTENSLFFYLLATKWKLST